MSVSAIRLTYAGVDIQDLSGIFLEIVRGMNEVPEVRGTDTVVPGRAGRIARNRIADRVVIELVGFVMGSTTAAAATETSGGADTLLTSPTVVGAIDIVPTDATGIAAGDLLRIGDPGDTNIEIRRVAGETGGIVTLAAVLMYAHEMNEAVVELDNYGASDRADFRANVEILRALFSPTRVPAVLMAELEDGSVASITARPLNLVSQQVAPEIAKVSVELESMDGDWTVSA